MPTARDGPKGDAAGELASLVILPGLLCDSRMFEAQVEAFHAEVIDGFYDGADRIRAMALYALERMPERVSLLGHSMGGRVAIEIWRLEPKRVDRLLLANTGVHQVLPGEADKRYKLRELGQTNGDEALVDAWLPGMVGESKRGHQDLMNSLRAMATDAGTAVFTRQIDALLNRPDAESVLASIDCPTFVVAAAEDQWSPIKQHQAIAAAIPKAELRVLAQAGHMAPAEDPAAFNEVVREWLSWAA